MQKALGQLYRVGNRLEIGLSDIEGLSVCICGESGSPVFGVFDLALGGLGTSTSSAHGDSEFVLQWRFR